MGKITASKKGLVTGALMLVLSILFFFILKKPIASEYQFAIWSIYTIGIIWSVFSFSKSATPQTKFKEYFSVGFKTFIVATFIMILFTWVYYLTHPEIANQFIIENNAALLKEKNHTFNEIEENAKQFKRMFIPMNLMIRTLMYLILGALISAISAGFLQGKVKGQ